MDLLTNSVIKWSFALYEIYAKIAYLFAVTFPSLTKFIVDKVAYYGYGITINGPDPTDTKVLIPEKFYPRVVSYLGYGVAEGYANREWTVDDLVGATVKIIKTNRFGYMMHPLRHIMTCLNLQSRKKAWEAAVHYDIGNEFHETILGQNLQYSSGYWKTAQNVDDAMTAKMDLVARKLHLKPGMRVLDIGCGFGTMGCYLAKHFNVSVVGCTISVEHLKYFKEHFEGSLPVEIRLCDYRDMNEKFDRIICVGMIEHVGHKNYDTFMAVVNRCLTDDGILLIECWSIHDNRFPNFDVWFSKNMTPNVEIPYIHQILSVTKKQWVIEDWHNMSHDYIQTTIAWMENFKNSYPMLQSKFGDHFCRAFKFFLCVSQGVFEMKKFFNFQIVFRKARNTEGYVSVR